MVFPTSFFPAYFTAYLTLLLCFPDQVDINTAQLQKSEESYVYRITRISILLNCRNLKNLMLPGSHGY